MFEGVSSWCMGIAVEAPFPRLKSTSSSSSSSEKEQNKFKAADKDAVAKKTQTRKILRRIVADVLDLAQPATVVGWIQASPGSVGVAMLGSTYLTSLEIWERCGKEVAAAKKK